MKRIEIAYINVFLSIYTYPTDRKYFKFVYLFFQLNQKKV